MLKMPKWSKPGSEVFQACGTETWVTTSSPANADSLGWLTPLSSYATEKKNTFPSSFLLEEAVWQNSDQ